MTGYLIHRISRIQIAIIGLIAFVFLFSFMNGDAVTIDDARFGSSQKNVTEVSGWLQKNAKEKRGFVLISAASHDAIIFSSDMPMKRFIHEGAGEYWTDATNNPTKWARWIVMRTNDPNDQTFELVNKTDQIQHYKLVGNYPFADIYELKEEYIPQLQFDEIY